jgi:seryl-tRNA synthetase
MLDLQFICENRSTVEENCRRRGAVADVGLVVALADERRQIIADGDRMRHEQKELSGRIPKTAAADEKQALIARGKELRELVSANEQQLREL